MVSLISILSTRVDFFAARKLEKCSLDPGKVHFEGSVHLLKYIWDNNNLGLIYYTKIEGAHLSGPLRQSIIKSENQLVVLYDSICQEFPDTGSSTGAYTVFYKGGPIDHCTHVSGTVSQSSSEIEYNTACTSGMDIVHFRMINNKLSNKDPYVVP